MCPPLCLHFRFVYKGVYCLLDHFLFILADRLNNPKLISGTGHETECKIKLLDVSSNI